MATNWSTYQNEIFNFIANGKGNAAISAVAGSGKTTTIVEAAKRANSSLSVLFLAFNKSIANELSERMESHTNVDCRTLHSHGFRALRNLKVRLNERTFNEDLVSNCIANSGIIDIDTDNQYLYSFKTNVIKLYRLCRINLIESGNLSAIEDLCEQHNIECVADEIKVVSIELENAYKPHKIIDYTDMIVLPLSDKKFIPKYDLVFIDECQDLSKAQRELMLASIKKGGRFVAVGDRKQAINGFAGASCDSFDLIANLPNTKELPLSVNYRCGSSIINLAQEIVPQILACDSAEKGSIEHTTSLKKLSVGDMILCRKSAPLVSLCLKLLANNIKANVKGKDIGVGLANLVKKLKAKNLNSLFSKLDKEREKLAAQLAKNNVKQDEIEEHPKMIGLLDKIACLEAIAESVNGISALLKKIEDIFSDLNDKNSVTLSTIHKAKGLESNNVFIVVPNKLPLTFKGQKDWQFEQEMNLKYVAITRAKKNLYFVDLDESELKRVDL